VIGRGHPVRRRGVEEHHPGDLLGVAGGVGHRVVAADRVPDQHIGPAFAGPVQKCVQVGGSLKAVLRVGRVLTPALPGAVVRAHPRSSGDVGRNAGPARRELAESADQHHGRCTRAGAVQVKLAAADVVQLPGHGGGALVGGEADGLHRTADGRGRRDRHNGVEQPAATPRGQGAAHAEAHPDGQREEQRRPDPAGGGQHPVPRRQDEQPEPGCGQPGGRNQGPPLRLIGHPSRQHRQHRPAGREAEQGRPGDDGLCPAGEHDQGENAGERRPCQQ
jgi:hypothetical protein